MFMQGIRCPTPGVALLTVEVIHAGGGENESCISRHMCFAAGRRCRKKQRALLIIVTQIGLAVAQDLAIWIGMCLDSFLYCVKPLSHLHTLATVRREL